MATVISKTNEKLNDLFAEVVVDGLITYPNRRLTLTKLSGAVIDLGYVGIGTDDLQDAVVSANQYTSEQLALAEAALNQAMADGQAAVLAQATADLAAEASRIDSDITAIQNSVSAIDGDLAGIGSNIETINFNVSAVTATANGKNSITYSSNPPVNGTSIGRPGDMWLVRSTAFSSISAQYECTTPNTWVSRTLENEMIANLDVGKLKGGFIDGEHINASVLTIGMSQVTGLVADLGAKETPAGALAKADAASIVAIEAQYANANSTFDKWTGAYPDSFSAWGGPAPVKNAINVLTGRWSMEFLADNTTAQGVTVSNTAAGLGAIPINTSYVTVEMDVMAKSGNFSGAGLLLDWVGSTAPTRNTVRLDTLIPTPIANKWYRVTKVLKRPNANGTQTGWQSIFMANWAGDGLGSLSAKNFVIDRLGFRQSTFEEITAVDSPGYADAVAGVNRGLAVEDLKNLWGMPGNTTLINGGNLFTNSVYAQSLALGDFTNLWADRYFNILPSSTLYFGAGNIVVTNASPPKGGNAIRFITRDHIANPSFSPSFECKAGDEFYAEFTYKYESGNIGTDPIFVGLFQSKADDSPITSTNWYNNASRTIVGTDTSLGNGWFRRKQNIQAHLTASDLAKARPWFNIDQAAGSGVSSVLVTDFTIRHRNGGELIVDGGIKADQLDADAVNGKIITGSLIQSRSENNRGVKIVTAENGGYGSIIGFNSLGIASFYLNGQTGAFTTLGPILTGGEITGAIVTGGTFQTKTGNASAIRMAGNIFIAYNAAGLPIVTINGDNGTVALSNLTAASTITGGTIQTEATASRGVKLNSSGINAYDGSGVSKFSVTTAGVVTITGGTIRTAATGERLEINTGTASTIKFFTGHAAETFPSQITVDTTSLEAYTEFTGPRTNTVISNPAYFRLESKIASPYRTKFGLYSYDGDIIATGALSVNANTVSIVGGGNISLKSAGAGRLYIKPSSDVYPMIWSEDINRALMFAGTGLYSTESTGNTACPIFASAFTVWSDSSHKSNFEPVSGAMAEINALTVFDYDTPHGGVMEEDAGETALNHTRGIIAQDLQEVAPHLVHDDSKAEGAGFGLGVDLYGLQATTIAALQEMYKDHLALQEEFLKLKREIENIKLKEGK